MRKFTDFDPSGSLKLSYKCGKTPKLLHRVLKINGKCGAEFPYPHPIFA